jgi:hypothetical protein
MSLFELFRPLSVQPACLGAFFVRSHAETTPRAGKRAERTKQTAYFAPADVPVPPILTNIEGWRYRATAIAFYSKAGKQRGGSGPVLAALHRATSCSGCL